jgi:hypothetical protein
MKTSQWAATSAAVITMCTLVSNRSFAAEGSEPNRIPMAPVGALSAYPTVVQTGTKPTLTWDILYPSKVSDVAIINPPGTIILTQDVFVSVQPVGTGLEGCKYTSSLASPPTDARMSVNGGSFFQLFYGTQADVDSAYSLYIKKRQKNDSIDFGGRYVKNGGWSSFYTTRNSNLQAIALVDGDVPPTHNPLHLDPNLQGYLRPYLDASGKVKVGPMSILILMELNETDHASKCFDYQDQVLVVTLSAKHPNNGHGNNLDGVDVSNPGGGSGGPNGEIDPSGDYDDEIK